MSQMDNLRSGVWKIGEFRDANRFLSNFYPCSVDMGDGILYPSAEHAYQAQKTLDMNQRRWIASLPTAGQAKRAGQAVTLRPAWETLKPGVMFRTVWAKFSQHPELAAALLNTGAYVLEEGNAWGDTYFGVDLATGRGLNMLGCILMEVRALLVLQVAH